jgi:hypothetical protein
VEPQDPSTPASPRPSAPPEDVPLAPGADDTQLTPAELARRTGSVRFRVDQRLVVAKVAGTVIFVLVALAFHGDPARVALAGLAAIVLGVYAARDIAAPERLAADAEGVTVITGFAGHRRLRWEEIQLVRVDERKRLGTRSGMLEIDTGETIHLFSAYDLGATVYDAAEAIDAVKR